MRFKSGHWYCITQVSIFELRRGDNSQPARTTKGPTTKYPYYYYIEQKVRFGYQRHLLEFGYRRIQNCKLIE
jgi:hypothetical protein